MLRLTLFLQCNVAVYLRSQRWHYSALVSLDGQSVDYIVWASKFGDEERP
jgi:hypothetical protein